MRKYLVPGPIKQHLHCKNIRAVLKGTASLGCFSCWLAWALEVPWYSQPTCWQPHESCRVERDLDTVWSLQMSFAPCQGPSHFDKSPTHECQNVKNPLFFTSTVIAHVACLCMRNRTMVVVLVCALSRNSNGGVKFLFHHVSFKIVNLVGPPFCWTPILSFRYIEIHLPMA